MHTVDEPCEIGVRQWALCSVLGVGVSISISISIEYFTHSASGAAPDRQMQIDFTHGGVVHLDLSPGLDQLDAILDAILDA